MAVVKQCVDAMEPYGDRVGLVMKADIRAGRTGQMSAKASGSGACSTTPPLRDDFVTFGGLWDGGPSAASAGTH